MTIGLNECDSCFSGVMFAVRLMGKVEGCLKKGYLSFCLYFDIFIGP